MLTILIGWFLTGMVHYALLSKHGGKLWSKEGWLSFDLERLLKALIAAIPTLIIAAVFLTLTARSSLTLIRPSTEFLPLLAVCTLFPIIEEWGRGMIIAFWQEAAGKALVGLIISSLTFALMHSMSADLVFFWTLTFGLLSGALTLWSRGIGAAILVHSLTNAVLVMLLAT